MDDYESPYRKLLNAVDDAMNALAGQDEKRAAAILAEARKEAEALSDGDVGPAEEAGVPAGAARAPAVNYRLENTDLCGIITLRVF